MAANTRIATLHSILAAYPGLDPRAVMAVASREGLGGGIGDNGTSFGPFQLHYGGAYPSSAPRGAAASQRWAWSPAGLKFALDRINQVAGGKRGRAAVEAIVNQFERPANPGAEIAGALGAYGGALPAGAPAPVAGPSAAAMPLPGGGDGGARRRALLALASSFDKPGVPDATPLLKALQAPAAPVFSGPSAVAEGGGVGNAPRPGAAGGLVEPLVGKLIGKPFQGTHGREFNIRGGSDNWESENAVDIGAKVGTPIRAVADGTIGQQFGSLNEGGRMAGLRLHLMTAGDEFYYAHLSRFAPGIRPGVRVRKGQIIGYSGAANGVGHLHFAEEHGNPTRYS